MKTITQLKEAKELNSKLLRIITPDQILEFAKQGLCPHYRAYNPVNKSVKYLFASNEINEWFNKNYIQFVKGAMNFELKIVEFNNPKIKTNVPGQLSQIEDLYEVDIDSLCDVSGIYFLCFNEEVIYVGQSVSIGNRVMTHKRSKVNKFNKVFFIFCPKHQLDYFESYFINLFNPKNNKVKKHYS